MNTKTACLVALLLLAAASCGATRTLLDDDDDDSQGQYVEAAGKPDICQGEWEEDEFECYFACADDDSPALYELDCECEDDCTKADCYIRSPTQAKFEFECPIEGGRVVSCDPAAWNAPFELLPCVRENATSILSAWRPSDD